MVISDYDPELVVSLIPRPKLKIAGHYRGERREDLSVQAYLLCVPSIFISFICAACGEY